MSVARYSSACLKTHGRRHGTHSKACGQGFPKADVGTFNGNGAPWHGEAPAGVTGTFAAGEKMGKSGQIGGYYHYHKVICMCMRMRMCMFTNQVNSGYCTNVWATS